MPTLVQEFDTRQFELGVLRIRSGLDTIEKTALQAGIGIDKAFGANSDKLDKTATATKGLGRETTVAGAALSTLRSILPAVTAGLAVNKIAEYANAWNAVEKTVSTVVPGVAAVNSVTGQLADIAADAGTSIQGTAATFQQFSIATRALNLGQAETLSLVDTLTRGLSIYATSTGAAASAQLQLAQAFASGRLQGDEFRSVAENFPPLLDAIAESLGVSRQEVRALSKDGVVDTTVLIDAFRILEDQLDGLANTVDRTTGQAFAGLGVRVQEFVGKLDNALGTSKLFTEFLDDLSQDINDIGNLIFPELSKAIETSADELERLGGFVIDAGGSLDDLSVNTGRAAIATQAYNEQLFEHRELLAEASEQAAISVLATKGVADTFRQSSESFEIYSRSGQVAAGTTDELGESVDEAANAFQRLFTGGGGGSGGGGIAGIVGRVFDAYSRSARGVIASNQELGDSVEDVVTEFRTLDGAPVTIEVYNKAVARAVIATGLLSQSAGNYSLAARAAFDATDDGTTAVERLTEQLEKAAEAEKEVADQARRLRDSRLDQIFKEYADETERLVAAAEALQEAQTEKALEDLVKGAESFEEASAAARDELEALADVSFDALTNGLAVLVGVGGRDLERFFENAILLSGDFGEAAKQSFDNFAIDLARNLGLSSQELDGFFGIATRALDAFGVEFESLLGDKATRIVRQFASLSSNEISFLSTAFDGLFTSISGVFGGLSGASANTARQVQGLGRTTQSVSQQAAGGLSEIGAAAALTAGEAAGIAVAVGTIGVAVADVVGADEFGQLGAGLGAIIGGAVAGPLGSAAGGILGGIFGGLFDELPEKSKEFEDAGRALAQAVRRGFVLDIQDLFDTVDLRTAQTSIEVLTREVNFLGEQLIVAAQKSGTLTDELDDVSGAALEAASNLGAVGFVGETGFNALTSTAATTADFIADQFNLSVVDVLTVLNRLGPDTVGSFALVRENAEEIARVLSEQFGFSVEEIQAVLGQLGVAADAAFDGIGTAGDTIAVAIAQSFGVSLELVRELLDTLPASATDSFNDLAANADQIARAIAVTFGLSFQEALALIQGLAASIGISVSDVGTTAADVAVDILEAFSGTDAQLTEIFGQLARAGIDAFDDIRQNADGSFTLVDAVAQAALINIVTAAGGTAADVQLILATLATNADIAFRDILFSGEFVFTNLTDEARASFEAILVQLGFTAREIGILFGDIAADGTTALEELEQIGVNIATNLLTAYGLTGTEIGVILNEIANNGEISFGDLSEAGKTALEVLLAQFGLSSQQIREILTNLGLAGQSAFGTIAGAGTDAANQIEGAISGAVGRVQSSFSTIAGAGVAAFSTIAGSASSSASSVSGSFSAAAGSARSSISSIVSAAAAATRAVNSIPRAPAPSFSDNPTALAQGGILTGPTVLSSPFGFSKGAFATGGILPDFTSIAAGGITRTSQLAIANEVPGEDEAVFPLAETSGGRLGVRGIIPDDDGRGRTVEVFIIEGVDRSVTDALKAEQIRQANSVSFQARGAATDLLLGRL